MPHVAARGEAAELPIVRRNLDALQDALGRHDLVRAHDEQHPVGGEHAVLGEDVEQRVPGEEGLGERGQVLNRPVGRIRPPRAELEGVGGLAHSSRAARFVEVLSPGGVRVVLRQCAVRNHEQLHVLEQAGPVPETVALVTADLVERLTDVDPTTLQLDMHHRQPVHEHGHVVAVSMLRATFLLGDLVLVDDLQPVVVDVRLVDECDVLRRTVVTLEQLDVILLDAHRLVDDAVVRAGDALGEELFPLGI